MVHEQQTMTTKDDFKLLDEPGLNSASTTTNSSLGWRRNKEGNLFGNLVSESTLFTEAAENDTSTQLGKLKLENKRLQQQARELLAQLRNRDDELSAANEKISQLSLDVEAISRHINDDQKNKQSPDLESAPISGDATCILGEF